MQYGTPGWYPLCLNTSSWFFLQFSILYESFYWRWNLAFLILWGVSNLTMTGYQDSLIMRKSWHNSNILVYWRQYISDDRDSLIGCHLLNLSTGKSSLYIWPTPTKPVRSALILYFFFRFVDVENVDIICCKMIYHLSHLLDVLL